MEALVIFIFLVWVLPCTFMILSRLKKLDEKMDLINSLRLGQAMKPPSPPRVTPPAAESPAPPTAQTVRTEEGMAGPVAPKSPEAPPPPAPCLSPETPALPKPPAPPPVPPPLPPKFTGAPEVLLPEREPGAFELAARGLWSRIWNWILVGEEYRRPGVSVEFAVATNWLVRIGVLILVVGVGFFLDYSARMGWLGDVGKVSLAGFSGAALVGWGLGLLNKKYHLFGQGLVGAGLAILYTTIFAAHQRYALIPPPAAFAGMFLVTVGAVALSVKAHSLLIAVLGIIGGYLTPFLLPDSGEVLGLLVYLAVLGSGVLAISVRRQWYVLNVLAFLFTSLHMAAMLLWWRDPVAFWVAMPFVTLYFLLFSTSGFLFQVLRRVKSTWLDLTFLLLNAGVFFLSARALILQNFPAKTLSAVTLFLALFYGGHLWLFLKRKGDDRGLALCFISLMSFFLLLTVPVFFSREWWTLCASLLALVLLAGSQKVNSRFLEQIAVGIFSLSLLRLLVDDLNSVYGVPMRPDLPMKLYLSGLLNRLMVMGVPLASLAGAYRLQLHPLSPWPEFQVGDGNDCPRALQTPVTCWILRAVLLGCAFLILNLEAFRSCSYFFPAGIPAMQTLVWVLTGGVLLKWMREHPAAEGLQALLIFFVSALTIKWLLMDLLRWNLILDLGRFHPYTFRDACVRMLDLILRTGFLVVCFRQVRNRDQSLRRFFGYAALGTFWLSTTLEVNSLLAAHVPGLRSGGLSVFWGLFALGLISAGLIQRQRPLRFLGLGLFVWVALKVFFSDLASLDPVYKIVAFILLGVVILGGAYVYMRFQDRFPLEEAECGNE